MYPYTEPPIPPFVVVVTPEDRVLPIYDVHLPGASGTVEDCSQFIADHRPPHGHMFRIQSVDDSFTEPPRFAAYLHLPPSNAVRPRLQMQDLRVAIESFLTPT